MKYFENASKAMNELNTGMNSAIKTFQTASKMIHENYGNSKKGNEMLTTARRVLTNTENQLKKAVFEAIKADFDTARKAVEAAVVVSVPDGFTATIEAVKLKAEKISNFEAMAYIEKYKSNYTAFTAIVDCLHKYGKCMDLHPFRAEDMIADIAKIEALFANTVRNWKQNDYYSALFANEQYSPCTALAANIEAFVSEGLEMDLN